MRKLVCLFVMAFVGLSLSAQENDSFEEKTIKLIKMTAGQQFEIMMDPLVKMVPQENQEAFKKELAESTNDLYSKMAKIYMESFTEAELDKILDFYATPVGKKLVAETPTLTKKGMELGQTWGMELQPLMAKYSK
ncbi:DUF2059 domain-containing protein [Gramella jeungdoensis]|uniref:DUF2059 domain-containing protein n=1 Tax=Gramella jeungdoensis TaxID=708091 RepID=A0ABT0Z540_9FLAO|nr:DUF2059 domain-containing protein [Gramella jeungdoensis]MCM8570538.1 DUF2059 domain-containing protein [Gramella jeungdoensis]